MTRLAMTLIAALLVLMVVPLAGAVEPDKKEHAVAGALIAGPIDIAGQAGGLTWGQRVSLSITAAAVIGVAKEVADNQSNNHTSEWQDAAYTIGGGLVAVAGAEFLGGGVRLLLGEDRVGVQVKY